MKTSQVFIIILSIVILAVLYATNVSLKKEYLKIDLENVYKNYVSVNSKPYSVLSISGSNGYPIEIFQNDTNTIKVLRSRLEHYKSTVKNDTLFIEFSGSNVSMRQSFLTTTPPGIVIHKNKISGIVNSNTHQRVSGFKNDHFNLVLKGNSHLELKNSKVKTLSVLTENDSQIQFLEHNTIDSLSLKMLNTSVANLTNINFKKVHPVLSDSIAIVVSKDTFKNLLKK